MPRSLRSWTSGLCGSIHIISRVSGGEFLFEKKEKEYLLLLLEKLSKGYFVDIHTFCIMSSHIHILATGREQKAMAASQRELFSRYKKIYGKEYDPPAGKQLRNGMVELDPDGGIERIRRRLGSVSRFTQDLKQSFSRWYNKETGRKGSLWAERFKGVIISKGEAELVCSAYIDLNPIRAQMVKIPEEYRWSSIGLRLRSPKRAKELLKEIDYEEVRGKRGQAWYRLFVYEAGHIRKGKSGSIFSKDAGKVREVMGRLGLGKKLLYRIRNLTEGQAVGTKELIEKAQKVNKRRKVKAREIFDTGVLYSTRSLD